MYSTSAHAHLSVYTGVLDNTCMCVCIGVYTIYTCMLYMVYEHYG